MHYDFQKSYIDVSDKVRKLSDWLPSITTTSKEWKNLQQSLTPNLVFQKTKIINVRFSSYMQIGISNNITYLKACT